MQVQTAFLITVTGGRKPDEGIFAAWPDGIVVWSNDTVKGGPPYQMAHIAQAELKRTVEEISRNGRWVGERHFGPDARWTHITVREGDEVVIDVGSWHELFEATRDIVATSTGIEPLNGRQTEDVLSKQVLEYRAFRARWNSVKASALSLIPVSRTKGEPVEAARIPW